MSCRHLDKNFLLQPIVPKIYTEEEFIVKFTINILGIGNETFKKVFERNT